MLKRFKNIRVRPLVSHLVITLLYPVARAITVPVNRLQIFTDALTITALVMLIGGVIYAFVLHGDFDISGFVLRRGMKRRGLDLEEQQKQQSFEAYMADQNAKREEAFNYPLFLAIVYILISLVIAYIIL